MRLVIGGPTRDTIPASFAVDLAELYAYTVRWPAGSVYLRFVQSTYVHVGREAVLEQALKIQATHLLWLDTDMAFPYNAAIRLLERDKAIVACNCVMKKDPPLFTAKRGEQTIESGPDAHGLETVDTVGMAVMLMRTDVVADLARPLFRHGLNDAGGDIGEDVRFCRLLRAAGHQIYIDHDLSKEIGHIGQHTYRPTADHPALTV